MIVYADTGFLISLYGRDINSSEAMNLARSKPVFLVTPLVEAEFANALELRVFRKDWTRREAQSVSDLFQHHRMGGVMRVSPFTLEMWERTLLLSRKHTAKIGTRTLDVVHVASASALRPDAFYSFDERQRALARLEKLKVLPA